MADIEMTNRRREEPESKEQPGVTGHTQQAARQMNAAHFFL
jgi:hypothetical protein